MENIDFESLIRLECEELAELLVSKNRKYGNSALNPLRVFSKADPIEQINVRLDDKLSRLKSDQLDDDEDVIKDMIGYLVLKRILVKLQEEEYNLKFPRIEADYKDEDIDLFPNQPWINRPTPCWGPGSVGIMEDNYQITNDDFEVRQYGPSVLITGIDEEDNSPFGDVIAIPLSKEDEELLQRWIDGEDVGDLDFDMEPRKSSEHFTNRFGGKQ